MKNSKKVKLELTQSELSWLEYVLRYVDECYAGEFEANCINKARSRELKLGRDLAYRIRKEIK